MKNFLNSSVVLAAAVVALSGAGSVAIAQQTAPEPKIGVIDLQRIAAESAEGKVANARIQALTQKKGAELQDKNKQLQTAQQKLAQGGAVLNETTQAQLQKDIERLTVEIERFQQDANAEVTELGQQLQGEFQQKLRPVIDAVVKDLALNFMFSVGDAGLIFWDPAADVTVEVIKRFDSAMATTAKPAPAPKPAAAPPAPPKPVPLPAPKPQP
jgi:Skp family chaperone for outer membrane proteins